MNGYHEYLAGIKFSELYQKPYKAKKFLKNKTKSKLLF